MRIALPLLFTALLPLAAQAGVRQDLDEARREIRTEMAQERIRLENENLELGDSFHFGKESGSKDAKRETLPRGEITPKGDLLIEGKAVVIDAQQRRQLLAYRTQIIDLAKFGIDAGERAAMAAIDTTDVSLFRLVIGGLSGSLERRVEATVQQHIAPMVLQICRRLPQVRDSQQVLAASVSQFRPYANLERDDVEDCERDVRDEFATR